MTKHYALTPPRNLLPSDPISPVVRHVLNGAALGEGVGNLIGSDRTTIRRLRTAGACLALLTALLQIGRTLPHSKRIR
jgi:hypothetical protein